MTRLYGRSEIIQVTCTKCGNPVENRTKNRKDIICKPCASKHRNDQRRANYKSKKK